MSKNLNIVYIIFSIVFLVYLALPTPDYPEPLDDVYISNEPADIESELRRGYYTDYERDEVMFHYTDQFDHIAGVSLKLLTYRLNYPPEEAQVIIRDQTRSTFLEEIVHPFRESLYVNGFKPTKANEVIIINDRNWNQKIITKTISSSRPTRLTLGAFTIILGWMLLREYILELKDIRKALIRK